jgi:hypothetical protein
MIRISIVVSALVAAVALVVSVPVGAAPKVVKRTVGPGFNMSLTQGGRDITTLRRGVYRFDVTDKSELHAFHLVGPGVDKTITGVAFQGKKSATVMLRRGTYRYVCDAHGPYMVGSFIVR